MDNLIIRYGKIKLNPSTRNLLRVIGLLADFKVDFKKDANEFILTDNKKKIDFPILQSFVNKSKLLDENSLLKINTKEDFEELIGIKESYDFDLLSGIAEESENKSNDIFKKKLWILFQIIIYTFETNGKFKNITYEEFLEIIDAILIYSNSYIKETVNFKDKTLSELWEKEYGYLAKFSVKGNSKVNFVNKSEAKEYLRLFEISKTGVESIDNAVETLLHILPEDAETILDIGSGPGYVNRNIPASYNVLAMDIDENILKDNIRKWCVGDILNIGLEDKSVEMSMACDVLEHIEKDLLKKAVSELERVSNKYIYIQVPFKEYLGESIALCSECGEKWHVNYHKNSFDFNGLKELLSDEWEVKTVAFTGEVLDYNSSQNAGKILDGMNINHHEVENWKCPSCGGNTIKVNQEYLDIANEVDQTFNVESTPCRYSEIGILFERKDHGSTCSHFWENVDDFEIVALNTSDLKFDNNFKLIKMQDYIKNSNTPYFISEDFDVIFAQDGMIMEKKIEGNGIISFVLPSSFGKDKKSIIFIGETVNKANFVICGLDLRGNEYKISEYNVNGGNFKFDIYIDDCTRSTYGYFKIYSNENFKLSNIKIADDSGKSYTKYIPKESATHLCKKISGIDFLWFVPKNGYIDMPNDLLLWLDSSAQKLEDGKIIFDYINIMYERLFELANSYKKRELIESEKYLKYADELYKQAILNEELLKEEIKIKEHYISILTEKLSGNSMRIQELEAEINLYKEKILAGNMKNRNHKVKAVLTKIAVKIIKILKKIAKIPGLYDFLVNIGAKKVYHKIKTRIKGDNKYE